MGCDNHSPQIAKNQNKFLLTHPVWDVTEKGEQEEEVNYISTHTSRVGCDQAVDVISKFNYISTHTSRVGCDHSTLQRL